jgi:CBS domain-containing protein
MATSWPNAGDLMTPKPITLSPEAPLSKALGIMRSKRFHELPVLRRNRLAGMITFESIARRINLPLSTKVEHLMVLPPVVTPTTSYSELAEQLLAAGMRAAPVISKRGEVVGVVSRTDLIRAIPDLPEIAIHRVEEIASPPAIVVREDERVSTLFAHVRHLEEHPIPVIDRKGRLVGAVGLYDLSQALWKPYRSGKRDAARHENVTDVEVLSIMRSPALTVKEGSTTGEAARLMSREKSSSVFVVEDGKPTGVVGQVDLLGLAIGKERGQEPTELGDVYVQIHGLRGSSDPTILTEVDQVVAKGLRRISRHVRPTLLSLHVSPHAVHRSGDATVQARLHTDRGIFYASQTEWNFYAGIAGVLEELEEQTRRKHEDGRRKSRPSTKTVPAEVQTADADTEAKIRAATGEDDAAE